MTSKDLGKPHNSRTHVSLLDIPTRVKGILQRNEIYFVSDLLESLESDCMSSGDTILNWQDRHRVPGTQYLIGKTDTVSMLEGKVV